MTDTTLYVLVGVTGLIAFSTLFVVYLANYAPVQPFDDAKDEADNAEAFVLARSQYHRDALEAYYLSLCELRGVDTHSEEGEHLLRVVYDGEKL